MSQEQKTSIKNHPNGREPGYVPGQSTTAEQGETEVTRHRLKSSEIPILHICNWNEDKEVNSTAQSLPPDQRSQKEQFGHYAFVVQTPKSLFWMDRCFMGPPQHRSPRRKLGKEKGEKKKSNRGQITYKTRHLPLEINPLLVLMEIKNTCEPRETLFTSKKEERKEKYSHANKSPFLPPLHRMTGFEF